MTRAQFIEAIESRGFKATGRKLININAMMYEREERRTLDRTPSEASVGRKYAWLRKGLAGDTHSFHLPYSAITEELITAVAGKRRFLIVTN